MPTNRKKAIQATGWSLLGANTTQLFVFIVSIILARILEPRQFGLIAMITVFSGWGTLFLNSGFRQAIIQALNPTQEDLSTVFFFNLGMGLLMSILLYFSSNAISHFYQQPQLVDLTRFVSLIFMLNAFSLIQRALLVKNLNLKAESIIMIVSALTSGSIAIFMALNGFGVWALATKILLQAFAESLLLWFIGGWRPSFVFRIGSLERFGRYALNMLGAGIINTMTRNLDNLVIGKLFSATQLGFFGRAKQLNNMAANNVGGALSKVIFPVLSSLQEDEKRFQKTYITMLRVVALVVFPLFLCLVVIAEPLIVMLLTEKWLPAAKLLQILALSGFVYPLSIVMVQAVAAKGRADIFLRLNILKTAVFLLALCVGAFWEITGIVIGLTVARFIGLFFNMREVSKLLDLPIMKQAGDLAIPGILSLLMLALLLVITDIGQLDLTNRLAILPLIGLIFYVITTYFFNRQTLEELKGIAYEVVG